MPDFANDCRRRVIQGNVHGSQIRWPERFDPRRAPVFVSNELSVPAPVQAVWQRLVRAPLWPTYYSNSADVVLDDGADALGEGTTFRWKTFGVKLRTRVTEFEPVQRIAWLAEGRGVEAYHAWLLTPTADGGCHILTQETQYGWLARLGRVLMPHRMHRQHQRWLEGLAATAKALPPRQS
jgi:hypothetical protein